MSMIDNFKYFFLLILRFYIIKF